MILVDENSFMVEPVLSAIRDALKLAESTSDYLRGVEPTSRDSNNPTRRIDLVAQQALKAKLRIVFEGAISFIAEEPERHEVAVPQDLTKSSVNVAILDPIDGTDLWVRGFGNWCVSTAIFDPVEAQILAAFVGYSSGDIYWATRHVACRRDKNDEDHPLSVPRAGLKLRDAAVCFYGQKAANFFAVHQNLHLLEWLGDMVAEKNGLRAPVKMLEVSDL